MKVSWSVEEAKLKVILLPQKVGPGLLFGHFTRAHKLASTDSTLFNRFSVTLLAHRTRLELVKTGSADDEFKFARDRFHIHLNVTTESIIQESAESATGVAQKQRLLHNYRYVEVKNRPNRHETQKILHLLLLITQQNQLYRNQQKVQEVFGLLRGYNTLECFGSPALR
jgi:hypothetical protein